VYKEAEVKAKGNACADKLASFGAQDLGYTWWNSSPPFIFEKLLRYRQGASLPFT